MPRFTLITIHLTKYQQKDNNQLILVLSLEIIYVFSFYIFKKILTKNNFKMLIYAKNYNNTVFFIRGLRTSL